MTVQVQLVVQALLRDPAREMYGLELSEETGLQPGTAYPILLRLEHEGWVASRGRTSTRVYLVSTRPEWKWAAAGCIMAFAVVSAVAGIPRRLAGRRVVLRKGSGLSGRGRDDGDGPAGQAMHRWRTLAVVSRLMPASASRRWLAEAESLLAEVTPARRGAAVRSYLLSAPRLAVMMWARQLLRRLRPGPRRPGCRPVPEGMPISCRYGVKRVAGERRWRAARS